MFSPIIAKLISTTIVVVATIYALVQWGKQAAPMLAAHEYYQRAYDAWMDLGIIFFVLLIVAVLVWIRTLRSIR